jgi:hypothetical protein
LLTSIFMPPPSGDTDLTIQRRDANARRDVRDAKNFQRKGLQEARHPFISRNMKQRRDISILATAAMPLATRSRDCARLSGAERQFGNPHSGCDGGSIG